MCVRVSVCDHYHSLTSHNTHCHTQTHTHTVHVFMTFSQMIRKVFAASTEHVPPRGAQDVHVKTYGILPGKTFNGLQNGHCQGAGSEGVREGGREGDGGH